MIKVTVVGPGGAINYPMIRIQRALEAAGISVTVVNDHPLQNTDVDQYLDRCDTYGNHTPVTLIAEHLPWGG